MLYLQPAIVHALHLMDAPSPRQVIAFTRFFDTAKALIDTP